MITPEARARREIDIALAEAGWDVQNPDEVNLHAVRGVAVRESGLRYGFGTADYLLFVDGQAAGAIEAKKQGETLTGVEVQTEKYSFGLPDGTPSLIMPLPFLYQSTGVETRFTNRLDPEPRSRGVFQFQRPETLATWAAAPGSGLRNRLKSMPPIAEAGLWPAQLVAVRNLETSLCDDRPRALIQMATGSGKTFTAITSIYRLIKFGGARRVLFLVDRANLGRQALKEFQQYVTPDDGRKFTELYNVQHLSSNKLDPVARVCITTIQRLYSMLQGEPELDPELEEGSQYDSGGGLVRAPEPVVYNPSIPIETFDVIVTDECHRSIYNLWRQVLEYFDASIIGLTATPSPQTFGFFNRNLVMEYSHAQAVADGVNVDFDVYRIRTQITGSGSKVQAGIFVDKRDRETRARRWEKLDEEFTYAASVLDRDVVAVDQIRTVVRTFRDRLFSEIFPGRTEVPKTLIYAKDDSHADDIVQIVREEFGKGNDFAQKITYKTGTARVVTRKLTPEGSEVEEVTYKSTGIKPLEIVMFLRAVKSRNYFEQMKGRGVRIINSTDFQAVTPDAPDKTHFVIVDCVGVCEQELTDSQPLERQPNVPFEKLLQAVAYGNSKPDVISSLAGRLARLDRQLGGPDREALAATAGGLTLKEIAGRMVEALDPDIQQAAARTAAGLLADAEPTPEQVAEAAKQLLRACVAPLATNPALRNQLIAMKKRFEQTIDTVSVDILLGAGLSAEAREKATTIVASFEQFIRENKDEITALQVLYSRPYAQRLRFADIKALAQAIEAPPHSWTPETLWRAYETLDKSRVHGSGGRMLTDVVALVRFALQQDQELVPYAEQVHERFRGWLERQEAEGRQFTEDQQRWLELIRDHIAASFAIQAQDFDEVPFAQHGGLGKVYQLFGERLEPLLDELNKVLAA